MFLIYDIASTITTLPHFLISSGYRLRNSDFLRRDRSWCPFTLRALGGIRGELPICHSVLRFVSLVCEARDSSRSEVWQIKDSFHANSAKSHFKWVVITPNGKRRTAGTLAQRENSRKSGLIGTPVPLGVWTFGSVFRRPFFRLGLLY